MTEKILPNAQAIFFSFSNQFLPALFLQASCGCISNRHCIARIPKWQGQRDHAFCRYLQSECRSRCHRLKIISSMEFAERVTARWIYFFSMYAPKNALQMLCTQ